MDINQGNTVVFRMNGVSAGFLREYGCQNCPQCAAAKPHAHISASLLVKKHQFRSKTLKTHLLFDCGLGAIDSLIEFGAPAVDWLFMSHGHPYHSLGLDRLLWGQFSHFRRGVLPLCCTAETMNSGPKRIYPWFFNEQQEPRLDPHLVIAKEPKVLGLGVDLCVTPVPVFQGPTAPGAVIWVVEFGQKEAGTYRKLVLGWEFIHFIPRHVPGGDENKAEDKSVDYDGPSTDARDLKAAFGTLFENVDELFFDGNTVTPRPETNHMSIEAGLRFLIRQVKPKRTWIVHYSGHEDPAGPLSDEHLQHWVDQAKPQYGLEGSEIRVAKQGMVLAYDV